jgi:membrane-bound lytic murein transglycosylase
VQVSDERIRLTKYVVFEAQGSPVQTATHTCALYALPEEEAALSADQAEKEKAKLIRYRYTKQQAVDGALAKHKVKSLVWVNRQGLEDALMQGSLMVKMPDGQTRMFNVHRNNGIAYDRRIKDPRLQKRYWYFKEVAGIQGYGKDEKIIVQPAVTVAGDVYNLGLGKLFALRYPLQGKTVMRLAVLADTGGAFIPNLYQLDYLAGVFPTRESYSKGVMHLPEYASASVLLLKE